MSSGYEQGVQPSRFSQTDSSQSSPPSSSYKGKIQLDRGAGVLDPQKDKTPGQTTPDPVEPLSEIIRLLNERFGTNFTDKDKVFLKGLEERLAGNEAL